MRPPHSENVPALLVILAALSTLVLCVGGCAFLVWPFA